MICLLDNPLLVNPQNGWKDVGSFLILREPAFDLLTHQSEMLERSVTQMTSDVGACIKNGSVDVAEAIERMGLLMDSCVSRSTNWGDASLAVEALLKVSKYNCYTNLDDLKQYTGVFH